MKKEIWSIIIQGILPVLFGVMIYNTYSHLREMAKSYPDNPLTNSDYTTLATPLHTIALLVFLFTMQLVTIQIQNLKLRKRVDELEISQIEKKDDKSTED